MKNFLTKKSHKHALIVVIMIVAAAAAWSFRTPSEYAPNPDPNHTHADFAIYIEDEKLDFSLDQYMSGVSYSEESHDEPKEYLHQYLHLHDNIGYVIHRHKPGYTVGDFLGSINFVMTDRCLTLDSGVMVCPNELGQKWRMFLRKTPLYDTEWEEVEWNPDYVFEDMDQILLTYQGVDAASEERIREQLEDMTDGSCLYSQTCPWVGPAPTENCIADPEVPCVIPIGE